MAAASAGVKVFRAAMGIIVPCMGKNIASPMVLCKRIAAPVSALRPLPPFVEGVPAKRRPGRPRAHKPKFVEVGGGLPLWATGALELVVDGRYVIRVGGGFDERTLGQVLDVLRSRSPRWPKHRVLELTPVHWTATAARDDVRARLAADPYRAITLLPDSLRSRPLLCRMAGVHARRLENVRHT